MKLKEFVEWLDGHGFERIVINDDIEIIRRRNP